MNKYALKQVLVEQREEIRELFQSKIIPREIAPRYQKTVEDPLVKAIIGARRSGKSVFAHQLLHGKAYGYINFDDERLRGMRAKDLNTVLEVIEEQLPGVRHLLLDEVQNVEGWELFVNRLKRQQYRVMVTGSNAKLLSGELATHLTGRHLVIELFPFSFREYLTYHELSYQAEDAYRTKQRASITRRLDEYLSTGAFPELPHIALKQKYLQDLYDKIITQDIVMRYHVRFGRALKELASLTLAQFGNKITYQKLGRIFQVGSVHTIQNYLQYLEEAYLLFQLYPFSFKAKERITGARKIYGIDTGLIRAVAAQFSPNQGKIMENAVFIELKRRQQECYYYTDASGHEVDFVVRGGTKVAQLIQVCADASDPDTHKREVRALLKASGEVRCSHLLVVTASEEGEERVKGKKIRYIPLWRWLLENAGR